VNFSGKNVSAYCCFFIGRKTKAIAQSDVYARKLLILEGDALGSRFFETGPLLASAGIAARETAPAGKSRVSPHVAAEY
jgi:hypothetical protein